MTIDELLLDLAVRGLQLKKADGDLLVGGNEELLEPSVVSELRAQKAALLERLGRETEGWWSPPAVITPEMLQLVQLTPEEIAGIVASVPGGAVNVQDIYPLAPLQEGILFHHLMGGEGDPYLLGVLLSFDARSLLDMYLVALQAVVDRHDILRTAIVWEGMPEPVQVVWRKATLSVQEVRLDPASADLAQELYRRYDPRRFRIDVRRAPLLRMYIAPDGESGRWLMMQLLHHLAGDHSTLQVMHEEVEAHLRGEADRLPRPLPFRNLVAQARLGMRQEEHEAFFRSLLEDVDEPTAPFGLLSAQGDGSGIQEARHNIGRALGRRLRAAARRLGVSVASVCHLAWAQVLARISGRSDVVFGTVLLGRMQGGAGADRAMGLFINTLPLRIEVGTQAAEASVRRVHAQLAELLRHEHASLALAQRCSGVPAPAPLFAALFNYRHSGAAADAGAHERRRVWEGVRWLYVEERTNYPVTLSVDDLSEDFYLTAQTEATVGATRICAYMRQALESLVSALESRPETAVGLLDVLPAAECEEILYKWNRTDAEYPRDKCIHELFEAQVEKTPDAVALVFEDASLSYGELNRRANRLGDYLRKSGLRPDDRVGICVERDLEMVVGVLAILKSGGAYVPLDPSYPVERLRYMLADSRPRMLLIGTALRSLFDGCVETLTVIDVDRGRGAWSDRPETNLDRADVQVTPEHLAYVIYTSGSTGGPKGVAIEHRNAVNLVHWARQHHALTLQRTLFSTSLNFDLSVYECFAPLASGATVTIVPDALSLIPSKTDVSLMNTVPSVMKTLIETDSVPDAVTAINLAGEALDSDLVGHILAVTHVDTVRNLYGPTETTTYSTAMSIERGKPLTVHIGQPIANTRTYILDVHQQPVPVGATGELYIAGAGVARGYWQRPGLTAERFLADPWAAGGARMYRTGDLVRWRPDGNIEFLARNDDQVKIRGFRIESGEIESRLREHPAVSEAVVAVRQDASDDKRLMAYYTCRDADSPDLDPELLRAHLAARLPQHFLPAAYVRLQSMPRTPGGKLDRKALPGPMADPSLVSKYEAPAGEIETRLARIWAEVLRVERVGRNDNFFKLGGHSLSAVRVVERLRREDLEVDVRMLFANSTLSELAATIRFRGPEFEVPPNRIPAGCTAITQEMLPLVPLTPGDIARIVASVPGGAVNVQDVYPLAPLQEGILFHHLLGGEGDTYLLSALLSFDNRPRLDRYLGALQTVVDRHDNLRTAVLWEGLSEPVQVVWRRAPLEVEEVVFEVDTADLAKEMYARYNPRHFRIDLRRAPLLRIYIAQDRGTGWWIMTQLLHHLAGDHSTLQVMHEEVEACLRGEADRLPRPLSFRNLVAQARLGARPEEDAVYFRKLLGDVEEPTAPFGLLNVQRDGTGIHEAYKKVDGSLARRLRKQARRLGVSAASVCHLAWAQVLARTSGREDVVFGTVLFGRMQGGAGSERAMGLFINTLPVRIHVATEGAEGAVRRVHAQLADLLGHEHASLALAQRCSGVPAPAPLFAALLNYRHNTPAPAGVHERQRTWEGVRWLYGEERTNYPFTLSIDDFGEDLGLAAQVDAAVGAGRICEYMHRSLESLVGALESAPELAAGVLEVLPAAEWEQVVRSWNRTDAEYPEERCVHQLFEEQVERTPDTVALALEDSSITYTELNHRANRLARYLQDFGVWPDARVGLCVERSLDMVVSVLAILKAGGAYVPLDPSYPAGRLRYIMQDSQPLLILTQQQLKIEWGETSESTPVIALEAIWHLVQEQLETNLDPASVGLTCDCLAYVIYTSGSTGLPKGAMNAHRGVVNRLHWMQTAYRLTSEDAVLQKTPFTFDVSVWELFLPIVVGARLALAKPEGQKDPGYVCTAVQRYQITTIHFVPSMLHAALDLGNLEECATLQRVICSGEALTPKAVARLKRLLPAANLENLYGPTEAAVDVTAWTCRGEAADLNTVPIGRPIANTKIYILDTSGNPVPSGVVGELHIGGVQVGRGYLNRPALTAERFVPDPFSGSSVRMYRTGDLGRWREDGTIEFLGRNDFQVKIRGFRIESGEIEARMREVSGVADAVVVAVEDAGDRRLAAYYTGADLSAAELRAQVAAMLPDYMVPAVYMRLDSFPLTPSGKLDRKALPAPAGAVHAAREYEAPVGEMEAICAGVWADLLKVERVGRHDNFFEMGGHSLLILRMAGRFMEAGIHISLSDVYSHQNVAELAKQLESQLDPELSSQAICVRPGGSTPPLFVSHILDELYVFTLAPHIDAGIPIYALPPPRSYSAPLKTIEGMARRMVRMIRAAYPDGPYRVAGYSLGGLLAYEVAAQLIASGQEVAFLGLMDSGLSLASNDQELHVQTMQSMDERAYLLSLLSRNESHDPELRGAVEAIRSAADGLSFDDLFAKCRGLAALPRHIRHIETPAQFKRRLDLLKLYGVAAIQYAPKYIPIRVHLITAVEDNSDTHDPLLGWQQILPDDQIRLTTIPGDHLSLMENPRIETLGQALSSAIREQYGSRPSRYQTAPASAIQNSETWNSDRSAAQ